MSTTNSFHSNALGVTGFLGGITFTTMVLIMQITEDLPLKEFLITGTAIVSVLLIVSTIGMVHVAFNPKKAGENFAKFLQTLATVGFFGITLMLPFLVHPFTEIGAYVLVIVEIVIIITYVSKRGN